MFINIAIRKINTLIKQEDFKEISFIDDKNVTILFTSKSCKVNSFGRVIWDETQSENDNKVVAAYLIKEYTIQDRQVAQEAIDDEFLKEHIANDGCPCGFWQCSGC